MAREKMSYWLGRAARALRTAHDLSMLDIATRAGVVESVIHEFETAGRGWRQKTDEIVAAYARELGIEPADVWQAALDAWRRSR